MLEDTNRNHHKSWQEITKSKLMVEAGRVERLGRREDVSQGRSKKHS